MPWSTVSRLPTSIYVFRDGRSFREYKLDREGRSENLAGYFVHGEEGIREFTSARLRTLNKGDWKYGRFEIRA